MKMAKNMGSDC